MRYSGMQAAQPRCVESRKGRLDTVFLRIQMGAHRI